MMNGKDREVLRSWLENLKQQRVERKKLKQARCQYSPHLEKLANFLPIQKPGTNLQPIQKRKSDATGTDLQPIPLKISRASPSVTRPATRSHPPRLEPLQEMFTQAPHLKLLNDPPIAIASEVSEVSQVPEVQEIPVVQEKPEVIEIPESPSFGCTAAGQPFGHLDPGSQEPPKKLAKGQSVQHISGVEKAILNKVDTRQYNQTLVTLPAMLSRAPRLEHLPEKRTHAPHLVQLLNDLPIPEAPEVPVVQEAPQTPEVQEIPVVPELHKIPESSSFRCTAAEQPSGHLDLGKGRPLQHISGGDKAVLQKVYYRQYKRQCELMNVDTIRHVGVKLKIDMDIHNRLLEMKMTLNLRTISDVLYFLLESYEIAKESEVLDQVGECTSEASKVHVASTVPQCRDRIPCRSQESSNYVTQSQIPSCSSQGVMPDHYTQCQANLNFIASGAPRGMITKRITQFQTNQVEKNRCDKEAADKAPSFNIPEEPRVHGEKRKRLKSPDILEKIEKNLKRSAKLVNQEPQVQGEKHESLQRTDILEQIENNLKRSANLVKQLEHERPFKVKLEDGTEEMEIAGKDKDDSNIHDVPSENPNCAKSSNTSKEDHSSKEDQANQKETSELILPGNHDSSLIAQSQSLTPYVVFRPSEIRIPNTICQTVTVAVPITEYETGQDDKDDEDSDDSIPEDASTQDVNCEESISEDAFTQDVNYQSMPSKYVLQKLRNKVQQRAKSMEGDGPARNRELGDSTIDQMVYDSTLEMAGEEDSDGIEEISKEDFDKDLCQEVPVTNRELQDVPLKTQVEEDDYDKEAIGKDDFPKDPFVDMVPITNSELNNALVKMEVDEDNCDKEEIGENGFHKGPFVENVPVTNSELNNAPLKMEMEEEEEEEAGEDESSEKEVPSTNSELDYAPLEIKVEKEDDDESIGEDNFCEDPSEKVVPSADTELDFAPLKMEVEEEDDDDVDDKEEIGEDDFQEESSEKELPSPNAELDFAPLEIKVEKEDNDGDDDKEEIGQDDCLADVSEKVVLSQNAEFDFAPLDMEMVDEDEELHKDNFHKELSEDKDDDDSDDCIVLDDETDKEVPVEEVDDDKEEIDDDDKEQESDEDDDYYPSEDEDSDDVDYEPSPKSLRKQENTSISNILKILSISIDDLICLPRATIQQLKTKYNLSPAQMAVVNKIRYLERLDMGEMAHRKAHWIVIKNLQSNLTQLQKEKHKLMEERDMMNKEMKKLADLYMQVYNKTFEGLQDLRGNPVDPTYFMLQHQPDGTVFLVPRDVQ